jgi:hypothetical protein
MMKIQRKGLRLIERHAVFLKTPRQIATPCFSAFLMAKAENDLKQNGTPVATLETCLEQT